MKITNIRLDRLRLNLDPPFHAAWDPTPRTHFDATVVRVETDQGIVGIGSGDTMDGFEAFEHLFIGTDPLQIMRQIRAIETINFHAGRFWPLEVALWDIIGKVTGVPVSVLFGNMATRIPAYMSTGELKSPEERVESALIARKQGFRAMKIRIDRHGIERGIASVRGVREALGDDFTIMVDLNQAWRMAGDVDPALDVKTVSRTVRRLEEMGVFWVEEPLPYTDLSGLKDLRASTGLRIAGGEMLPSFNDVLTYLDHDLLDVYQMDCVLAIGMHRSRTAAELAQHRNRQFTPHSWTNGIGVLANLHVAAGVGAAPYFEFPYDPSGWTAERRDFMLTKPVWIDTDGYVNVPDTPGIGVELDEDAVERCAVR
ncbi:mandelate racemase/muconate lactonizing enzyme family protein [Amycolatopsis palatopharyngis]|uniref:mandelate racemase/muconate lactonizing enzyme family protein n=1 Tax=Amycolatopsis palatopharyngis TaxID=187982 RepID=UPI000E259A75|nr:mandelate racemase/muconate lactonizing enzyme family protein [Amycolatopsis palatopharyngis]